MARAIWSGSVSFGLVSIPVKLYSATEPKDVQFHQFQKGTGKRIHNKRVAGNGDKEVAFGDIVKGYEASKGEFVIVTPEELESVEPTRTRTIEIEDFVDLDQIDPIYFEKTYYLGPDGTAAAKPYALLLKAMQESNRIAVGRFVLRTKEYLAAIRPMDGVLALETLYFADEIRDPAKGIETLPVRSNVTKRELDVALQLIDAQAGSWDPTKYEDRYRDAVLKLIRNKAKGKEIVVEKGAEPEKIEDLMEALRLSVEQIKSRTPARPSKPRKTASRTRKSTTTKGRKKAA
jgi:DNA end-binding protein Ku